MYKSYFYKYYGTIPITRSDVEKYTVKNLSFYQGTDTHLNSFDAHLLQGQFIEFRRIASFLEEFLKLKSSQTAS